MSVDPLADAGGQQVLSPYHAMGGNPVSMVDPLGLQYFAPANPVVVQDPSAFARSVAPTLMEHMPGGSLWGLSNMTRYISSLPKDLQAEAWMMYLSGRATGSQTFINNLGDYLRQKAYKGEESKGNKTANAFTQLVYSIQNGNFDENILDEVIVLGYSYKTPIFDPWANFLKRELPKKNGILDDIRKFFWDPPTEAMVDANGVITAYGAARMAERRAELSMVFKRVTPLGRAVSITQSIYEMASQPHKYSGMTGNEIISKYKKASVREEFPGQYLDKTWETIASEANKGIKSAQTAKKLLTDGRFSK